MITAISNVNASSSKQFSQVAFQGNPARLIEAELGSKVSRLGEKTTDFFSKLAKEEKLPSTKKALIAADKNSGPPIADVSGNPIPDPDMPGTCLHYLAKGDPGFVEHADGILEHIGNAMGHVGDAIGHIFEALF